MMQQYFDSTIQGIEARMATAAPSTTHHKRFALEASRLGARLYGGQETVAWCGVLAPFDLLNALGVTSCYVEFVGGVLASTGMIEGFLGAAEQQGLTTDSCGYHRAVFGATEQGMMPEPDFLIATSAPCSGGVATLEHLSRQFGKDLFMLHIPQRNDAAGVAYLAGQLREMVAFVVAHTGRPLDQDRLREAIALSNQTRELLVETYRLAEAVPSPLAGRDLDSYGIVLSLLFGTQAAVEVARDFRDTLAARVQAGQAGVPGERVRLMWLQNRVQFKNQLVALLEKELQVSLVNDELNDVTWDPIDPDDPYPGMARRAISLPLNGAVDHRIAHLQDLARRYQVHGAINPCHWGCRQGSGSRGLIHEGLKQVGVPVLNLEVDCVDPRNFAEGQLRTRLQAFVEMLEGQPSPWA